MQPANQCLRYDGRRALIGSLLTTGSLNPQLLSYSILTISFFSREKNIIYLLFKLAVFSGNLKSLNIWVPDVYHMCRAVTVTHGNLDSVGVHCGKL